jgi:hypothetical protein
MCLLPLLIVGILSISWIVGFIDIETMAVLNTFFIVIFIGHFILIDGYGFVPGGDYG